MDKDRLIYFNLTMLGHKSCLKLIVGIYQLHETFNVTE